VFLFDRENIAGNYHEFIEKDLKRKPLRKKMFFLMVFYVPKFVRARVF
tara:strand:+ start:1017 stop:1160 length:144 start_codon:yes stop_codon:yes gene_type:complete